jgi:hypothetical protein
MTSLPPKSIFKSNLTRTTILAALFALAISPSPLQAAYRALYRSSFNAFTSSYYLAQYTQANIEACPSASDAAVKSPGLPTWLGPWLKQYTPTFPASDSFYGGLYDVFLAYSDGYREYLLYYAYNDFANFAAYWNLIESYSAAISDVSNSYRSAYDAQRQSAEEFLGQQLLADPTLEPVVYNAIDSCLARLYLTDWYSNGSYYFWALGVNLYQTWTYYGEPYFALGSYLSQLANATRSQMDNQSNGLYYSYARGRDPALQSRLEETVAYYSAIEAYYDAYAGYYLATSLLYES